MEALLIQRARTTTITESVFMLGLVKTMWTSMSSFWTHHLNQVHRKDQPGPSPDNMLELQSHIRILHSKCTETLAAHQSQYFHDDLDEFLQLTISQLKTYLLNYEPAIYDSIKHAKKLASTSVLSFLGYTLTPVARTNQTRQPTTNVTSEVPRHRKHSRWRQTQQAVAQFRTFFQPSTTP
jgi:hypothetical protein